MCKTALQLECAVYLTMQVGFLLHAAGCVVLMQPFRCLHSTLRAAPATDARRSKLVSIYDTAVDLAPLQHGMASILRSLNPIIDRMSKSLSGVLHKL